MFLSPEQLANGETRDTLRRARPGLFAVDEAHLISQWGRDFRPDYMRLGAQAEAVGAPVRLALTATAAPPVRQEIIRRLGLRDPVVVIGDFDRPHIQLSAHHVRTVPDKERELVRAARRVRRPGDRLRGDARQRAGGARRARGGGRAGDAVSRRAVRARAARGDDGVPGRLGPHHRGHGRVRHGDRQAGRALGAARRPAALAGCVLPGDRARRPGRPAVARAAAVPLRGFRDGALPDGARASPARPSRGPRPRSRPGSGSSRARGSRRPRWPGWPISARRPGRRTAMSAGPGR